MFASVRRYPGAAHLADELTARSGEVKTLIGDIPGFIAYFLVKSDDDAVSVSVFSDEDGPRVSNSIAAGWLRDNLPDMSLPEPEITNGRVVISNWASGE